MTVSRLAVLEELAAWTDAERGETITIDSLVEALDSDWHEVGAHLRQLEHCDLALFESSRAVRVTITGEELLALDTDETVIVDPEARPVQALIREGRESRTRMEGTPTDGRE